MQNWTEFGNRLHKKTVFEGGSHEDLSCSLYFYSK